MAKAKTEGTELAKVAATETAIAVPDTLKGGLVIDGDDGSGSASDIGRLICYQGTPTEEKKYGNPRDTGFARGDFVDPLALRIIGQKVKVMFVGGWMEWVNWPKDSPQPIYRFRNKAEVPTEDLEWDRSSTPNRPPVAREVVNAICVVGDENGNVEPWPYVFVFKSTSLQTWDRVIKPMEGRRRTLGKGPGSFWLTTKDDKNGQGQDFKRVVASFAGDPDAAMLTLGATIKAGIAGIQAAAEQVVKDAETDPDGDGIPI